MRRFQDPGLFTDPLTRALVKAGYVPLGLQALYRIASYAVDPVTFGPWLAVVLAPLSAWLVFLIVREHSDWWPAAWMGAALFMLPVNSLRFSGGHARAFGQPVVLLTVYLLLRRRYWMAASVPAVGSLFYPPGAVSALAIMAASCLTLRGRRPSLERARTLPALACVAASGIGLLLPRLIGREQALITRSQAHALPDFGPGGQMHFFSNSVLSTLKGTYSGLDIGPSLAILLFTPVVLLALRPRNILLLRRELLWMLATSLLLYALAFAVLFRLYLPNRYTYPLLPFSCVAIAVAWRPTFESLGQRLRPALAWLLIPLGLAISLAAAYLAVRVEARRGGGQGGRGGGRTGRNPAPGRGGDRRPRGQPRRTLRSRSRDAAVPRYTAQEHHHRWGSDCDRLRDDRLGAAGGDLAQAVPGVQQQVPERRAPAHVRDDRRLLWRLAVEHTRAASALRRRLPGRAARVAGRSHGPAGLAAHGTVHRDRQPADALDQRTRGPAAPGSLPHLRGRSQRGLRPALCRGRLMRLT